MPSAVAFLQQYKSDLASQQKIILENLINMVDGSCFLATG